MTCAVDPMRWGLLFVALGIALLAQTRSARADAPLAAKKIFGTPRDNMTELAIRVYQADREIHSVRDEGVTCIGEFFLKGIPPKPRGAEPVTVTFEIDQQNLLKVDATSPSVAERLEIQRA